MDGLLASWECSTKYTTTHIGLRFLSNYVGKQMRGLKVFMMIMFFCLLMLLWHPVSAASADDWAIQNGGFEKGIIGWEHGGGGSLAVTSTNPHSGNYSMEISSSIIQQAYFYQYIDFPNTSFVYSFWLFRANPTSSTACYLARDWDQNTARIVSSLVIQGNMIELNAWDAPFAPGRQVYSYNVAVGSWHNVTFVANNALKTQGFYIDGNLIATLNSSSGSVFNPDILIFGDVTNEACNGVFYFDDFKLEPLETATPSPSPTPTPTPTTSPSPTPSATPTPTPIPSPTSSTPTLVVSCKSSTSYSGFNVQIIGSLTFNGTGISEAPILLSYSANGGKSWIDLTLVYTGSDGSYLVTWMPSVTGNYLLKAVWEGNEIYSNTSTIVNLAVTPFAEQSVFSVTSNSTISEFSFNSTSRELRFGVSGPSGTTGYVNVYIPKSLIGNISSLQVYLDGNQTDYTAASQSDGWFLYFIYQHSTHVVTINVGSSVQANENPLANWMLYGILLAIVIIVIGVVLALKRGKNVKEMPLSSL